MDMYVDFLETLKLIINVATTSTSVSQTNAKTKQTKSHQLFLPYLTQKTLKFGYREEFVYSGD